MNANPNAFTVLHHPSLDQGGGGRVAAEAVRQVAAPMLESTDLLKGGKAVAILHNGSLYRLQATRLGKLILTK